MKIVIDIPEDMYNDANILIVKDLPELKKIIANGIPYEERPQGEWLWLGDNPNPNHKWSCNKCGRGVKAQENFCPNCGVKMGKGGADCMDEDAKQASIPYTYNAPQHDWKCGYPDITRGKE